MYIKYMYIYIHMYIYIPIQKDLVKLTHIYHIKQILLWFHHILAKKNWWGESSHAFALEKCCGELEKVS